MANNICPKPGCTNLRHENRPYCLEHGREWSKLKQRRQPQVVTEEQWQRALARARERHAERTPEERAAYLAKRGEQRRKWLDSDPAIRQRHNVKAMAKRVTWSAERRERQKRTSKDNYDRRQLRPAKGLCGYSVNCNEPPVGIQRFCLSHWCKGVMMVNGKRISCTCDDLVSLWKRQDGKCAITGSTITPGSTAELDHIIPVYAGGSGAIENLRYVHGMFNRMKSHMTDEELKKIIPEFCSKMIEWAKLP